MKRLIKAACIVLCLGTWAVAADPPHPADLLNANCTKLVSGEFSMAVTYGLSPDESTISGVETFDVKFDYGLMAFDMVRSYGEAPRTRTYRIVRNQDSRNLKEGNRQTWKTDPPSFFSKSAHYQELFDIRAIGIAGPALLTHSWRVSFDDNIASLRQATAEKVGPNTYRIFKDENGYCYERVIKLEAISGMPLETVSRIVKYKGQPVNFESFRETVEWKEINGVHVPETWRIESQGKHFATSIFTWQAVNPVYEPDTFTVSTEVIAEQ